MLLGTIYLGVETELTLASRFIILVSNDANDRWCRSVVSLLGHSVSQESVTIYQAGGR